VARLRTEDSEAKRAAVMRLLLDPQWSGWSDKEIARQAGASKFIVSQLRLPADRRTYRDQWGRIKQMNVAPMRAKRGLK